MAALRLSFLALVAGCFVAPPAQPSPDDRRADQPDPTGATYVVEVKATETGWRIRHAGRDGRLRTDDDVWETDAWHLPTERRVRLRLTSSDVPHTLLVPAVGFRLGAIPGQVVRGEFATPVPGRYRFRCAIHGAHEAELFVWNDDDFVKWLSDQHPR